MRENTEPEDGLRDHIGISSRFLPGEYERLMDLPSESGFGVFELCVGNFGALDSRWPRTCDAEVRERLRENSQSFSHVILRATSEGLNIAIIITSFAPRLFEIHASGVYRSSTYFPTDGWGIDHYPFEMNEGVDYSQILETLGRVD